eukprot:GILK01004454.1.p1 GENE.GILK01004454.1~~GILK01004454.1.p1  ORF type:complete len:354 (+),score=41.66 GILK01004454.1:39-1064(+)
MKMRCSLFVALLLFSSIANAETSVTVTLRIFSSSQDPTWGLNSLQTSTLKELLSVEAQRPVASSRVLGYRGFVISPVTERVSRFVFGNPAVEEFLLSTMPTGLLNEQAVKHVREEIASHAQKSFLPHSCNKLDSQCGRINNLFDFGPCCSGFSCECDQVDQQCRCVEENLAGPSVFSNDECESNLPIRGPDSPPKFDVMTDDLGCFTTEQWNNNCYNYGNDVLTNSFAQPGRGTSAKWQVNTCEDVKRAAVSDGLTWVGTSLPQEHPDHGHYIALLIWPDTNFHWARKDIDGTWSHKPGGTPVKNTDNSGAAITDPSKSDFAPWTQFCGYFVTVPSAVTIN